MERSEKSGGPRQVALRLGDSRFRGERVDVVRDDIENLVDFPQGFGKTTKTDVISSVAGEEGNVARVESLGFDEVRFAPVPLAASPFHVGEGLRNPAAIG